MLLLLVALNNISLSCHTAEEKVKGRKAEHSTYCQSHLVSLSPLAMLRLCGKWSTWPKLVLGHFLGRKIQYTCEPTTVLICQVLWKISLLLRLRAFYKIHTWAQCSNPSASFERNTSPHTAWPRREPILPRWVCSFWPALIHDTMT